ncbi:MAG: hypothetical protein D3909_18090, partial [Candidatus Electrothrix sp. ATG1]|nr:hypothetical protein [Candidatus Electrothrix sp. ATG1]
MKHIIRKQQFEISASDIDYAKRIQTLVSDMLQTEILPLMDTILTDHSSENTLLRLEKLEVDLGTLNYDNFAEQFLYRISQELSKALKKKLPQQVEPPNSVQTVQNNAVSLQTSAIEQLRCFLEIGQLPWWAADSPSYDPEQALLTLLQETPEAVTRLLTSLADSNAVERLTKQFSPSAHQTILESLLPSQHREAVQENTACWAILKQYLTPVGSLPNADELQIRILAAVLANPPLLSSLRSFADTLLAIDVEVLRTLNPADAAFLRKRVEDQFSPASRERQWLENMFACFYGRNKILENNDKFNGSESQEQDKGKSGDTDIHKNNAVPRTARHAEPEQSIADQPDKDINRSESSYIRDSSERPDTTPPKQAKKTVAEKYQTLLDN